MSVRIYAFNLRDGQSGKITVDDYGARTGKSPGQMRQLNINGDLYIGKFLLIAKVRYPLVSSRYV